MLPTTNKLPIPIGGTPKNTHINNNLREKIIMMHKNHKPIKEIADTLGVARNTVYLWIRRWKEEGNLDTRKAAGRPRKTTAFEDQIILQSYCQNLKVTDMAKANNISTASLRRRLKEAGLMVHKPLRKKIRSKQFTHGFEPHRADSMCQQPVMQSAPVNMGLPSDMSSPLENLGST